MDILFLSQLASCFPQVAFSSFKLALLVAESGQLLFQF
jgi:hypothetical protein